MKRDAWIESRMDELLPTAYYHIVFTLPHELNPVFMGNRAKLFDLLFLAASQTLLKHAKMPEYLGAEPGITMVLHTWGQDLSFHPHSLSRASGYTASSVLEDMTDRDG
ncbi:Putative transposase [Belliella pelovolcani]|uniref:Putative transposase n=2 Tax=Belliella pelovolcani TaxID=529505 RepID=A0A1N7LS53_9BACT|nr:Putative transposase [Belliella pelovolcani]